MANTETRLTPKLDATELYLGDNGRCFCGSLRCAGMTAHFTGRDLSGQKVAKITLRDNEALVAAIGRSFACETCGRSLGPDPLAVDHRCDDEEA